MINKIDYIINYKNINLKDTVKELEIFKEDAEEWILGEGYCKYLIKPTFTIMDRVQGLTSYSVEVVEYVKD